MHRIIKARRLGLMLYSGADLIRMGALQDQLAQTLVRRGERPRVVKGVEMDADSEGDPGGALERFARRLRKAKPEPLSQPASGYARSTSYKKGEILDIYA